MKMLGTSGERNLPTFTITADSFKGQNHFKLDFVAAVFVFFVYLQVCVLVH